MRLRGIYIASCRTQDSGRRLCSWAIRLAGTSSACITTRTRARHPAWCSWMPRTRMPARFKACPIANRPPIPRSVIRGLSIVLGRLGMMRFLASPPGPPPKYWTAAEWDILARLRRQRNVLLADAKVGPGHATDDLVRSAGGLEDMPLIVLTQGNPSSPSSAAPGVLRGWVDLQRRFAERSRRGRQVLVPDSGHGIPEEAPEAVISAVREIVTTVRADFP